MIIYKEARYSVFSDRKLLYYNTFHRSLSTLQGMQQTILKETQQASHGGAFILVIMSHGTENGGIYGVDTKAMELDSVYDLLSSANFKPMAGKPKLIVIQACGGGTCGFFNAVTTKNIKI